MNSNANLISADHSYAVTLTALGGESYTYTDSMLIATPTGSTLTDLTGYPNCVYDDNSCTYFDDFDTWES